MRVVLFLTLVACGGSSTPPSEPNEGRTSRTSADPGPASRGSGPPSAQRDRVGGEGTPTDANAREAEPSEHDDEAARAGANQTAAAETNDLPLGACTPAEAAEVARLLALPPSVSTSVGGPSYGELQGGVSLPRRGPGFRHNPRRDRAARFGTVEMVQALVRAARIVQEEIPGSELTINDLGYEHGGPIPHHGSHQAGRDVDVLFYVLGPDATPTSAVGAFLDLEGRGVDFRDLSDPSDDLPRRIDLPRTWRFVQALLDDESPPLQRIFVAEHIRAMLLEHARASGAPESAIARFEMLTCQPGYPHDDHFHFRFFCAPDDIEAGCKDSAPIYPWHRRAMRAEGVTPVRAGPERRRAPITTADEARAAAGPMDAEVERWLARREAWMDNPHPGRPWCH